MPQKRLETPGYLRDADQGIRETSLWEPFQVVFEALFCCSDFANRGSLTFLGERVQQEESPAMNRYVKDPVLDIATYPQFPEIRGFELLCVGHPQGNTELFKEQ